MPKNHIILYSHGFAVDKGSRGLFTDIASSLPDMQHIMFDYNNVSADGNTIRVSPIDVQVARLQQKIAELMRVAPKGTTIDMVCHSLGCVIAALAAPTSFRRILLLAPPFVVGEAHTRKAFAGRRGVSLDTAGDSFFVRKDGVTAIVPAEYWPSLEGIDPVPLYAQLARHADLRIITAAQDELLAMQGKHATVPGAHEYSVDATHNFTHDGRPKLLATLKPILI